MNPPLPWNAVLAKNIRDRRRHARLSQEALADLVGVDVRYLGGIERLQENPSLKVIEAIAKALGTTPYDLLSPWPSEEE